MCRFVGGSVHKEVFVGTAWVVKGSHRGVFVGKGGVCAGL